MKESLTYWKGCSICIRSDNEHFLIGCIPRNFEETRSEKSVLELVKDIDRLSRHYLVRRSDTREYYILGNPVENLKYFEFFILGILAKTCLRGHANFA